MEKIKHIFKFFILFVFICFFCKSLIAQNFKLSYFVNNNTYNIEFVDTVNGKQDLVTFFWDSKKEIYNEEKQRIETIFCPDTFINRKIDTLLLIRELLNFEGDNRISSLHIINYGTGLNSSSFYTGKVNQISLQVHALYLIRFLVFPKNSNYSVFPVLQKQNYECSFFLKIIALMKKECWLNKKSCLCESGTSGYLIKKAYKYYKEWYDIANEIGIEQIKRQQIMPFYNSDIRWVN